MSHFCSSFFRQKPDRASEGYSSKFRKGKILEVFRAFKKIYWEVIDQVVDHLLGQQIQRCASSRRQKHCELF
jgi:hypothetical protein